MENELITQELLTQPEFTVKLLSFKVIDTSGICPIKTVWL